MSNGYIGPGNMLGGFIKGLAQGKMYQAQAAQDKETNALKKQMMQTQIASEKTAQEMTKLKLAEAQNKQKILDALMPALFGQQGGPQNVSALPESAEDPTQFGESFGGQGGLTDEIANQQISLTALAPILQMITGVPFQDMYENQMDERRFNRDAQRTRIEKVPDGQGGFHYVEKPYYSGIESGSVVGYEPPQLGAIDITKGGEVFHQPINKTTQQPVGPPTLKSEKKGMPAESAGKLGMLKSGLEAVRQVKEMIMPNGDVDKDSYILIGQMQGNIPWTKGREARSLMRDALEGKIRIESGAAVPDPEVVRMAERFEPKVFDTPELIKLKLNRMERYLSGTIEALDPNKNYTGDIMTFTGDDGKQYAWVPKQPETQKITKEKAVEFLKMAGGDKKKAQEIAKQEGYTW